VLATDDPTTVGTAQEVWRSVTDGLSESVERVTDQVVELGCEVPLTRRTSKPVLRHANGGHDAFSRALEAVLDKALNQDASESPRIGVLAISELRPVALDQASDFAHVIVPKSKHKVQHKPDLASNGLPESEGLAKGRGFRPRSK